MEQHKLTELEISEKLCDIAFKYETIKSYKEGVGISLILRVNSFFALYANLISLLKEVGFDNLSYIQKRIAKKSWECLNENIRYYLNVLKEEKTLDSYLSCEDDKICNQLTSFKL